MSTPSINQDLDTFVCKNNIYHPEDLYLVSQKNRWRRHLSHTSVATPTRCQETRTLSTKTLTIRSIIDEITSLSCELPSSFCLLYSCCSLLFSDSLLRLLCDCSDTRGKKRKRLLLRLFCFLLPMYEPCSRIFVPII